MKRLIGWIEKRRVKRDSNNREAVLKLLSAFFNGNAKKVQLWMNSPNPLLGGLTPNFMVSNGRSDRLLEFVLNAVEENKRA